MSLTVSPSCVTRASLDLPASIVVLLGLRGPDPGRKDWGVDAIAMVVDRFSDKIVENAKLNMNPALKEWNGTGGLPGLKFMRTLWLCEAAGGPFHYTGKDMSEAHTDLGITPEEFDEVGREIAGALDHFKVPEREKGEVLAAIVAHKSEVVQGGDRTFSASRLHI